MITADRIVAEDLHAESRRALCAKWWEKRASHEFTFFLLTLERGELTEFAIDMWNWIRDVKGMSLTFSWGTLLASWERRINRLVDEMWG